MAAVEQIKIKTPTFSPILSSHDLHMAFIVARREVRDSFRDWRIIIPIFLLTLCFPGIMNFTAQRLLNYVGQFGADLIAERLIPFLLLVVGFFPMSFSLVIALETFVGEKERKSLEPLLATPLTDKQLYMGKVLAAIVPPLVASYLGMIVYLVGLKLTVNWQPSLELAIQAFLLTAVQGVVMVSGAVVVSSQTTTVRASNLLASFIIVPMALLIQVEAVNMFFANYDGLWWIIIGMVVISLVLIRMGIHLFNREELLGRDIDHLHLGAMARHFGRRFWGRDDVDTGGGIIGWFRGTFRLVRLLKMPALAALVALIGSLIIGQLFAQAHPFTAELGQKFLSSDPVENLQAIQNMQHALPLTIFGQNIRVVSLQMLLGVFSFGVIGILIFMLPWGLISFAAAQMVILGESPTLLLAAILPHATLEFPALLLITAAALRWHILVIAPPPGRTVQESWLDAAADCARLCLGIGLPLLILAAFVEAYVTPAILVNLYG